MRQRHALGQRHGGEVHAVVDRGKTAHVHGQLCRDVAGQALDLHRGHDLLQHADLEIGHSRRFAHRHDRNIDDQLLTQVHCEEINVQVARGARIHLQLADQNLERAAAVKLQVDQVAAAGAVPHAIQQPRLDGQRERLDVVTVEHGGYLAAPSKRVHVLTAFGASFRGKRKGCGHSSALL
jgi:hypothetical protein